MNIIYRACEGVLQTDMGDEVVLIDGRSGKAYRLNATARAAWLALPTDVERLAGRFRECYGIDPVIAERDAQQVLQGLADKNLAAIDRRGG